MPFATCKFCEIESVDSWYSSYCVRCHKTKVKSLLKEELSERVSQFIQKKEKKLEKLETIDETKEENDKNNKLTKM